ncbi:NAD(P)-dependent oxidoreductase [Occultella gossypii]|uniref:Hydroxyacid dehydrogenase n=1 Tax=Occultella gossypii TaxID=2800820 RepID=A0ABS7SD28_9MICO|nr:NAD(P)-dependent oxidoreductase [Occultella gossypii]MBZ2197967.1 hydroxyacid dehydrogenase [Occultella gossypii]
MNEIVLVIGDPLMAVEQLAAPAEALLGTRFEVRRASWQATQPEAIAMNRRIEAGGPAAVDAVLHSDADDDRVVGIITQFFPLSREVLARWPRLRAVATMRAGTENIDRTALADRGVAFAANAGRNANAVAEMTVALMLATLRDVGEGHRHVRDGGWRPEPLPLGLRELSGRCLGLVGYGAVGRLVQRRLVGFDLDVLVSDPFLDPAGLSDGRLVTLDELVASADVVSLHARSSPQTRGLLGATHLSAMRSDAILVNTARADLLDESALVAELQRGGISGAGLDVFSVEPMPADSPLRTMRGVVLSPHLAGATVEARSRAPELVARNLESLLLPAA